MKAMRRVILAGSDEVLLPLLERLRARGGADIAGLLPAETDSLAGFYAEIMRLPLVTAR